MKLDHLVNVRVTKAEREQMRQVAESNNTTVAAIIRQAFDLAPANTPKNGEAK